MELFGVSLATSSDLTAVAVRSRTIISCTITITPTCNSWDGCPDTNSPASALPTFGLDVGCLLGKDLVLVDRSRLLGDRNLTVLRSVRRGSRRVNRPVSCRSWWSPCWVLPTWQVVVVWWSTWSWSSGLRFASGDRTAVIVRSPWWRWSGCRWSCRSWSRLGSVSGALCLPSGRYRRYGWFIWRSFVVGGDVVGLDVSYSDVCTSAESFLWTATDLRCAIFTAAPIISYNLKKLENLRMNLNILFNLIIGYRILFKSLLEICLKDIFNVIIKNKSWFTSNVQWSKH